MPQQHFLKGGCYFFTVATHRYKKFLPGRIHRLRKSFRHAMNKKPFSLDAVVILPDHIHCIWTLPYGDTDCALRWSLIQNHFIRDLDLPPHYESSKAIWQPHSEYAIRDRDTLHRHLDYIHYDPVQHAYVDKPQDWRHSSFQRYFARGWYHHGWGTSVPESIRDMGGRICDF